MSFGCSVPNCKIKPGIRAFRFPKDLHRRNHWINLIKRSNWEPGETSRICEKHFRPSEIHTGINGKPVLKKDAMPSIFPFQQGKALQDHDYGFEKRPEEDKPKIQVFQPEPELMESPAIDDPLAVEIKSEPFEDSETVNLEPEVVLNVKKEFIAKNEVDNIATSEE